MRISWLLSTSLLIFRTSAAPALQQSQLAKRVAFQCFHGANFPDQSQWLSFEDLFTANLPVLSQSNSATENSAIKSAIQSVAGSVPIDPRIVLAQAMQETKGSVHDQPGDDGKSFGILQVQVQSGTPAQCSGTAPGACSNSTITTMVQQGVLGHSGLGTAVAPGIGFWIQQQNGNVGQALRGYNTGSVPNPNDLSQVTQGSTPSYVSSVGNRLLGVTDEAIPQAPGQLEQCGFNDPQ